MSHGRSSTPRGSASDKALMAQCLILLASLVVSNANLTPQQEAVIPGLIKKLKKRLEIK